MSEDQIFRLLHMLSLFVYLAGLGATMLPLYRAWNSDDVQRQVYAFQEAGRNQAGVLLPGMILTGVTGVVWAIVADGVLQTWLLDSRSARQLDLASTGHATRGTSGPPSPSCSNLWLEPGAESAEALIGGVTSGLYVTELIGMGVNMVTGDYSRGAAGFWIEQGEIAYPVSEVTVAGNLKEMFRHLTPASDLEFRYGVDSPTVRIDGMTVAGR